MNKSDLVSELSKQTRMSQKEAKRAIDALFDSRGRKGIIASQLQEGHKVTIAGFGTFEMRRRKARTGRNPRTGQPITIGPSKYPAFRAGVSLKERLS